MSNRRKVLTLSAWERASRRSASQQPSSNRKFCCTPVRRRLSRHPAFPQRILGKNSKVRNSFSRIARESANCRRTDSQPRDGGRIPVPRPVRVRRSSPRASSKFKLPKNHPHPPTPHAPRLIRRSALPISSKNPRENLKGAQFENQQILEESSKVRSSPRSHAPHGNALSNAPRPKNQRQIHPPPRPMEAARLAIRFAPRIPPNNSRENLKGAQLNFSNSPRISQRCAPRPTAGFLHPPSSILHPRSSKPHPSINPPPSRSDNPKFRIIFQIRKLEKNRVFSEDTGPAPAAIHLYRPNPI